MIKEKFGHRIDGWVQIAFPFLFRRPINPDGLTVMGTLIAGSAGWAFAEGALGLGGALLLTGGVFDLVDGVVARHFGISTRFGAFLDSSLDRVVDMLAALGLFAFFAEKGEGFMAGVCAVILVSSVLTSYAKARAELIIPRMPGGLLERGERIGLMAIGVLLGGLRPILVLLAIGSSVTVGQRFLYAYREMAQLDRDEAVGPAQPPNAQDAAMGSKGEAIR